MNFKYTKCLIALAVIATIGHIAGSSIASLDEETVSAAIKAASRPAERAQ